MEAKSPKISRYQAVPVSAEDEEDDDHRYTFASSPRDPRAPSHATLTAGGTGPSPLRAHTSDTGVDYGDEDRAADEIDRHPNIRNNRSIEDAASSINSGIDDDENDDETNSLVDESSNSRRHRAAFRRTMSNNEAQSQHTSPNRQTLSLTSSMDDALGGSDWGDDDDVELNLRRYHLDFPREGDLPLPAEFVGHSLTDRLQFTLHQWWTLGQHHWSTLRQSARQRRAARLLTMPSESARYQCQTCFINSCCDATDAGIALVVGVVCVWIFVGRVWHIDAPMFWATGGVVFGIRVSARHVYETCYTRRRRRRLATLDEEAVAAVATSRHGSSSRNGAYALPLDGVV